MSTLLQLEARVSARLVDATNSVFALATIDEGLRTALADYSAAYPLAIDSSITLPSAGREIDLSSLTGLLSVLDVWWPYNAAVEAWPPNQVPGFHLWFNNAVPKLLISSQSGSQPQTGDIVRVWYTKQHTIQSLDGAGATSMLPLHETGVVDGASAYAVVSEMRHQIANMHLDPGQTAQGDGHHPIAPPKADPQQIAALNQWSNERLVEFRAWLTVLHTTAATTGALKHTLAARNPGPP